MSTVRSERQGGVRTITLDRPERLNAMSAALLDDVTAAFAEANDDAGTRAIIFTGAGRAFCAGDDLLEHRQPEDEAAARAMVERIQKVTEQIVFGPKIVVGAINGWAVGGGLEWAIDCDLAIWAESARGFFPEMQWGFFVTGGVTAILPKLVGLARAKELILFGEKLTARQLHELGVAWRVVPDDRLLAEAQSAAGRIAALPPRAVSDLKRVMTRAAFADVGRALALETDATVRAFLDPETTARVAAFASR